MQFDAKIPGGTLEGEWDRLLFDDTAATEVYTLSRLAAVPI